MSRSVRKKSIAGVTGVSAADNAKIQTWTYGGVPFEVGRPELVATHPDYRRRGLVRAQFEAVAPTLRPAIELDREALEEWTSGRVILPLERDPGQAVQAGDDVGMLCAKPPLGDGQGALEERLSLGIATPVRVEPSQVVEAGEGVGMGRPEHALPSFQSALHERLGRDRPCRLGDGFQQIPMECGKSAADSAKVGISAANRAEEVLRDVGLAAT